MTSKTCTKCKETKPVSEFTKDGSKKEGIKTNCKECVREAQRKYYANNPEKVRERNRRSRLNNPEQQRERNRRWREANKAQKSRQEAKRRREKNNRAFELAHRKGLPWEDWEEEFLLADNGLTNYQKAVKLGRSYDSVVGRKTYIGKNITPKKKSARAELTTNTVRV